VPGPPYPMHPTDDSTSPVLDHASRACLARTRSAVLNVLVAMGLTIAISGWLLRMRSADLERPLPSKSVHLGMMAGLIVLGTASYLSRRLMGRRAALRDSSRRERLFFWSHVLPSLIAALAAPLGLAYGWFVVPRLEVVIPFWVVPIALGFLSLPREQELADFDQPMTHAGASPQ
jgi:hypothetical protein